MLDQQEPQVSTGVTSEAAVPTEDQSVQFIAQTIDPAAQPTVEGQGTPETQQAIPYERFSQLNNDNKALQQQLQIANQQNQFYQQQQVQQQPQQQSRLEQFVAKLESIEDDGTGAININEAKELAGAISDSLGTIKQSQAENQRASYLAANPDFVELVQKDTVLGPQFTPDFTQMLSENPIALQQLTQLANNPLAQTQQALAYAREYQRNKVIQQVQAPASVPGLQPAGAPPSLSAVPVSQGAQSPQGIMGIQDNNEFLAAVSAMKKT